MTTQCFLKKEAVETVSYITVNEYWDRNKHRAGVFFDKIKLDR